MIRVAVIVATVVTVGAISGPVRADDRDALEQQHQGVAGQIDNAKKALDESSKNFVRATSELKSAQAQLGNAKAHLGQTQQALAGAKALDATLKVKLDQAEVDLDQAKDQLDEGKKEHARATDSVRQFTVENLTKGDPRLLAFGDLLRGEDPITFSEKMALNDSVSDAQIAKMQQLAADKVILKLHEEQVEKLRDEVEQARQETQANVVRQGQLTEQAQAQTEEVGQLVDKRADAQKDAEKAKAEDEKQLKELEDERVRLEARIAAMVEAAKQAAAQGQNVGDGGGKLSAPISGPITSPYGMRVHPITHVYKLHDGTDFGASCGTPIRAAAGGQILDQYFNGGYGNRVILNNGVMDGHVIVTTYNHLSRFALSKGATVNRGDVIGYVGSTGYSTGCHLHFMVLVDGVTTNPIGWL
jgi:murein DD-endopeptidase MepM/ murein hydrolase activator NlpD